MKDFKENTITKTDWQIVKRLVSYAKPFQKNFIIASLMMILDVAASSIGPILIGYTIQIIDSNQSVSDKMFNFLWISILFLGIVIGVSFIIYYQN